MNNFVQIINQLVEIRQKVKEEKLMSKFERNFNRLFSLLEDDGFIIKYPLGEKYSETCTEYEANIVGRESKNMVITHVIKPVVYQKSESGMNLIQKGIVIVEKS